MSRDFLQKSPPHDTLIAAVIYLMTRHARTSCPMIGALVARHPRCLGLHPETRLSPGLREPCTSMADQGGRMTRSVQPAPSVAARERLH